MVPKAVCLAPSSCYCHRHAHPARGPRPWPAQNSGPCPVPPGSSPSSWVLKVCQAEVLGGGPAAALISSPGITAWRWRQWPQRRWPHHFRADPLPCPSPALRTLHPRVPGSLALVPQLALLETLLGGGRAGSGLKLYRCVPGVAQHGPWPVPGTGSGSSCLRTATL